MTAFRQTVEEALRVPVGHLGVTGQGVFVASFDAAAGMIFDVVWLVGMIEGQTPPAFRPDPLLPEAGWQAAGGGSRLAERTAGERYGYLSAIASAPRRALSYPVADASSQREAYPSRWFLEQASALEGHRVHTGDLRRLAGRPWLSVNQSTEQALSAVDDTALADCHDYHLHRLLQWQREGNRLASHPFAQQGNLARAASLERSRNLRRLTEFDGNLAGVAAGSEVFGKRLTESAVSATSLESLGYLPIPLFSRPRPAPERPGYAGRNRHNQRFGSGVSGTRHPGGVHQRFRRIRRFACARRNPGATKAGSGSPGSQRGNS